nr:hypothetical protein [uncultured Methanolobus sp.]
MSQILYSDILWIPAGVNMDEYIKMCEEATELHEGLLTLDQLWSIILGGSSIVPLFEIRSYYHWLEDRCDESHDYCLRNNTLEKCLLSYLMYIKYHMEWDGSTWVYFGR